MASTAGPTTYSVGDYAHGGIVVFVEPNGQHGIVVAMQNTSDAIKWYPSVTNFTLGVQGNGVYMGYQNFIVIYSMVSTYNNTNGINVDLEYAAKAALNYRTLYSGLPEASSTSNPETYGDWYLPTITELFKFYSNKTVVNAALVANGGIAITDSRYWSSVEGYQPFGYNAFTLNNITGVSEFVDKYQTHSLRVFRRF